MILRTGWRAKRVSRFFPCLQGMIDFRWRYDSPVPEVSHALNRNPANFHTEIRVSLLTGEGHAKGFGKWDQGMVNVEEDRQVRSNN